MKQRFLNGLDVLICLYLAVVLRLASVGGFTLGVRPVRISVRGYTNVLIALAGLLALRRWFRGFLFKGFRLPLDSAVRAVSRSPAIIFASPRRFLTAPGFAARSVVAAALVTGVLAVVVQTLNPLQGLTGRYFDNPDWSGSPVFIAGDREPSLRRIQKDWYSTDYSVEWTGVIDIAERGDYRFALASDNESEMWIDGELVADDGRAHGARIATRVTHLGDGLHAIQIRYAHRQGAATLSATWGHELINGRRPETPLSTAILFPARPSQWAFSLVRALHRFVAALTFVLPTALLVLLAAALLGGCDLLFDKRRASSQLIANVRGLTRAGTKAAAYAVEFTLLCTLALWLWVVLLGSFTLPLGPHPFLVFAALFVLRHVVEGSMTGGFRLPPVVTAAFAGWRTRVRAWLRRRTATPAGRIRFVAAALLAVSLVGIVNVIDESERGLTGRYYENADGSGPLITTAHDRDLTRRRPIYDFGSSRHLYSIDWTGVIFSPAPGDYRFALTSDGGSRLWIGGALVVDNGGSHEVERVEGVARMSPGFHDLRLRYAHNRNVPGAFGAEWAGASTESFRPLSSAVLFPASPARSRAAYAWFRFVRGLLAVLALLLIGGLTVAYLFGWHWLLSELSLVAEHHVHIGLLASVAVVYYLASFGGLHDYWGFSKLQGFGAFRTVPILVVAAVPLMAYRRYRARCEFAVAKVQMFLSSHPMAVLGVAGLSVLVFFGLRNEFVNSDGTMYRWVILSVLAKQMTVNFDEMGEQFLHAWFWHYTNAAFGWSVRVSYQVASSVAGGAFILLLWSYARRLIPGSAVAFLLLMVSGGYMQLFCGEVENYSFVAVGILAYCLVSAKFLRGESSIVVPSAILFLAMAFHMLAGFLLPSLGILYLVALRRRAYLQIGLAIAASVLVLACVMVVVGEPITSLYQGSWGTQAIHRLLLVAVTPAGALRDAAGESKNWAFFTFDQYHWDQYNLLALMFPAHLALIPLLLFGRIKRDAINLHLVVAALGMAFFQFNYRALLPIEHDWNLFASAALPMAILVSRTLAGAEGLRLKAEIVTGWVSLSAIHTGAWILSNHRFMP